MGILAYFVHQQSKTIQDERRASIRRSCQDQNARHDKTIQILDQQIDKLPPDRKARAERSKQFTILLINALAPKQDCNKIVKLSVHS